MKTKDQHKLQDRVADAALKEGKSPREASVAGMAALLAQLQKEGR